MKGALEDEATAWLKGETLAINIVINFEEGSQAGAVPGEAAWEVANEPILRRTTSDEDVFSDSTYDYGIRRGLPRLLGLLGERQLPATVFACGRSVEIYAPAAREMSERGFDYVGHGYRWTPGCQLSRLEMRADIERTRMCIEDATGAQMRGWFSRSPVSEVVELAVRDAGLTFHSMGCARDRPYRSDDGGVLIVPYTTDVNDFRFWRRTMFTGGQFAQYAVDTLDSLYRRRSRGAVMMSVGLHPRVIGRPSRFGGLVEFINRLADYPGLWVARRTDLAEAWASRSGGNRGIGT